MYNKLVCFNLIDFFHYLLTNTGRLFISHYFKYCDNVSYRDVLGQYYHTILVISHISTPDHIYALISNMEEQLSRNSKLDI